MYKLSNLKHYQSLSVLPTLRTLTKKQCETCSMECYILCNVYNKQPLLINFASTDATSVYISSNIHNSESDM